MIHQLTGVWKYRHFLLALVRLDIRLRYGRAYFGVWWSLLNPLAMTAVMVVVFSQLFGRDPAEYSKNFLLGMAVWGFCRECAVSGCQAITSHETYIRQTALPFGLYSLRLVLGQAVHSSIALAVALVAVVIADGHLSNLVMLGAVAPALLLMVLAGWAVATLLAFANAYFSDTKNLLEIGTQILFFLTPIFYPAEVLVDRGLGWLCRINPVNLFLELIRTPLARGELPEAKLYVYAAAATAALALAAFATTRRLQKTVIFRL